MKYDTLTEACHAWVDSFNAIPVSAIEKLWEASDYADFEEITPYDDDWDEDLESQFPMWGTMWSFSDPCDEEWANGEYLGPHLKEMMDCGFRIYESEDFGIVFGIDGAGYNFFDEHWIPLYKARGLRWHEKDDTLKEAV